MSGEHGIKGQASSPAPQAPQTTSEWKPIESAPRDGTYVLLGWWGLKNDFHQTVGHWSDKINGRDDAGWTDYGVQSWGYEEYSILTPAHWMPLPPPPQSQIEEPRSGDDDSQPTQESA